MHTQARNIALDEIKYLDSIDFVSQLHLKQSVTHRVRNRLLEQGYPEEARQYLIDACTGMPLGTPAAIERWDTEVIELHNRVGADSRKRD